MKVLLAEDEVTIAVTLGDALEEAGHTVFVAPDTERALELLQAETPDLVITDVRMPGAGGHAVLERSMELAPERPVIVMTGFATIDKAVQRGNERLSRTEQVKRYAIVPCFWLPGGDELTPTNKLKRTAVNAKYASVIEDLYA